MANRLGPRLIAATAAFLIVLAAATVALFINGLRQTQQNAVERSSQLLIAEQRDALLDITIREAQINTGEFQDAVTAARHAVALLETGGPLGVTAPVDAARQLTAQPEGYFMDPDPDRISDTYVPKYYPVDEQALRELRRSAILDGLVPTLLEQNPAVQAAYFIAEDFRFVRFYPVVDFADVVGPTDPGYENTGEFPYYYQAAPQANPERASIWTDTYLDDGVCMCLMVTTSTPVYDGATFRGVFGLDISLQQMIERLNTVKTTPGGYAFLVDGDGHLIAAPPAALPDLSPAGMITTLTDTLDLDLTQVDNLPFQQALSAVRAGRQGVAEVTLASGPALLAYAPLPATGWGMGVVAPIAEITAPTQAMIIEIEQRNQALLQMVLLILTGFFVVALVGTALVSRRLTSPLGLLIKGTQAIASGDLSIRIPIQSHNEFGELARSFNTMTSELALARGRLEEVNAGLEQTVAERTAALQASNRELVSAKQAAEEANQLKTRFLANMSHELRTPLNAILNFTRFLSKERYGGLSERQIELQQRILANADHLLGLINDILDLSKIEAGRIELHYESVELAPLMQGVMATAVGLTRDKGLSLELELAEDLPSIRADKTRVRQVLLNLLSNAAKFTLQGGINVRVSRHDEQFVCIAVQDSGIGVAPEDQALIFEEFRQVQSDLTREYQGTGLGLPISKRLIEMHGGKLWMESTPGAGSTFFCTLPCRPLEPGKGSNAPILVVDDDPTAQNIFQRCLGEQGYTVISVLDSREALERIRTDQPALVILDIVMPHLDGWEVLAQLKSTLATAHIPVMICSVLDAQALGVAVGASDYLVKPINEAELTAHVARLVHAAGTVLVVDDDPDARQVIRLALDPHGYRVVEAGDGAAGLTLLEAERPDLLVLDLMMPGMDGFEVIERLRATPAHTDLPVLVVTAKDLNDTERQWLQERSQFCLEKSQFSLDQFTDYIGRLTNGTGRRH